ncbi:DUF4384 domain-containing protein [Sulfitobacter noctilucicola]|nr:DUF4384 domain-containing protein [Sulfitobacter noctilucicola]
MAALQPQPVSDQPTPESRLNVEAQEVARTDATQQTPASDEAARQDGDVANLGSGEIAQSRAEPLDAPSDQARAQSLPTLTAVSAKAPAERLENVATPQADVQVAAGLPIQTSAALSLPVAVSATTSVKPDRISSLPTQTVMTAPTLPEPASAIAKPPETAPTPSFEPSRTALSEQAPEVTSGKATLAFPSSGPVDPVSLAAFQSFTQTTQTSGSDVRDSLSAALSVPCARMQVLFDPDTVTLQLTGHVPTAADRAPVLKALETQMGTDIKVAENLLVLPAPQCGALSGIANVGLPQSTDQITNPMIVGADTHARAFRYVTGDPLVLDLTAPDYPAYIYVDYFDADGNVIHLSPNDQTPLQKAEPETALQIGARTAQEAGLFVTIGPPYGQEIAAAFASSVPLYSGNRPLVEPAEPYLAWLKGQVENARQATADFKGEWVYFFVTTAAQ